MPLQMISCTQCEQLAQGLYLCNGQQANGLQNRHKWLDEWCLGSRLHAFTDDLVHAVDGRFAKQWTRGHQPQQHVDELRVGDQRDIDPRYVGTDYLQTCADQRRSRLFVSSLQKHTQTVGQLGNVRLWYEWQNKMFVRVSVNSRQINNCAISYDNRN